MRKLLLSFLVIGATVFTSCDKGDDMMTPAQVAADVKSISPVVYGEESDPFAFEDAADYDLSNPSGKEISTEAINGWSLFKTGVTKRGFAKYYYGTEATYVRKNGRSRKVTVVVLSFNKENGQLNQYSIRHNDVKIIKNRILRASGIFESTVKNNTYGAENIPELIANVIAGVTGASGTSGASKGFSSSSFSSSSKPFENIHPSVDVLAAYGADSDGDTWVDTHETELVMSGWVKENGDDKSQYYVKTGFVLGFEPGNSVGSYSIDDRGLGTYTNIDFSQKPFYFDGVVEGYRGAWDLSSIGEVTGALNVYTEPEIALLLGAGFSHLGGHAAVEQNYHIGGLTDGGGYLTIGRYELDNGTIEFSVFDDEGHEDLEGNSLFPDMDHLTLQEAIDYVLELLALDTSLPTPSTPDYIEDTFDSLSGTPVAWSIAEGEALMAAGFVFDDVVGIAANSDVVVQHKNGGWTVGTPTIFNSSARLYTDFSLALAYAISLTSD